MAVLAALFRYGLALSYACTTHGLGGSAFACQRGSANDQQTVDSSSEAVACTCLAYCEPICRLSMPPSASLPAACIAESQVRDLYLSTGDVTCSAQIGWLLL